MDSESEDIARRHLVLKDHLYARLQTFCVAYHCPKFVQAKIGKKKDSESALQCLRGKNADISAESAEIRASFLLYIFLMYYLCYMDSARGVMLDNCVHVYKGQTRRYIENPWFVFWENLNLNGEVDVANWFLKIN